MRSSILFLITILTALPLTAQHYLWPTNASPYLSSSFCEYRPGHFHAAIDIKTWNREGYPCYAVEDGVVEHVRMSVFGGGKALYIRLTDGHLAVYFHLQRFIKPLEEMIFRKQIREERYAVEIRPKGFKIKKGQVVAYTGQTGIGVPHLHFEIRDKNNVPLNPLRFYPQVKDHRPPTLQQVAIIPLDASTTVNGRHAPLVLELHKNKKTASYVPREPVYVRGRVGLALKGYDRADGVYNKLAFYKTALYAGARRIFEQKFDLMPFSKTGQVEIFIHHPLKSKTGGRFQKLYKESFNTLPVYDEQTGNGMVRVGDSARVLRVDVSDFKGNTSHLRLTLNAAPLKPDLYRYTMYDSALYLDCVLPPRLKELNFYSGATEKNARKADAYEIHFTQGQRAVIRMPRPASRDTLLGMELHTGRDVRRYEYVLQYGGKTEAVFSHWGKWLRLQWNNLFHPDSLYIGSDTGQHAVVLPLGRHVERVLTARDLRKGLLQIKGPGGLDTTFHIFPLFPGQADTAVYWDNRLRVSVSSRTVYDTLLLTLRRINPDNPLPNTPVSAWMYDLNSGGEVLRKPLTLEIMADSLLRRHHPLHVYGVTQNGLSFWGGDSVGPGRISVRRKSLGRFVLAADTVAPVIRWRTPADSARFNFGDKIRFSAMDSLSGIGTERHIDVRWDSIFVLPEWDFENHTVSAKLHFKPQPGWHRITLTVKDQAGNIRRTRRTVFVK